MLYYMSIGLEIFLDSHTVTFLAFSTEFPSAFFDPILFLFSAPSRAFGVLFFLCGGCCGSGGRGGGGGSGGSRSGGSGGWRGSIYMRGETSTLGREVETNKRPKPKPRKQWELRELCGRGCYQLFKTREFD